MEELIRFMANKLGMTPGKLVRIIVTEWLELNAPIAYTVNDRRQA